jgi:hypothetical protein
MTFKEKAKEEFIKASSLTLYFGVWFCALAFLAATISDQDPIKPVPFGFALIKAGLCAKFMLIAQAIYPIAIDKEHGLFQSLFKKSLFYLFLVLILSYLESGVDGLIHHTGFIEGLLDFGHRNPLRILAMSIVYWLIVWPYLLFCGVNIALGSLSAKELLFGSNSKD